MIATFLIQIHDFVEPAFIVVALLCVIVAGVCLRRPRRGRRVLQVLVGLAVLAIVVLTLIPTGLAPSPYFCTVAFSLPHWGAVETSANIMLFVPAAIFATALSRRPWRVLAVGVGLSALIELAQGLVPVIGRACDTNDLWMNSLGVAVGVALGAVALRLARGGGDSATRDGRATLRNTDLPSQAAPDKLERRYRT